MRGLRNFERRLERVESKIAAEEKAKAAAAKAERDEVDSLEEVLERSEPCPFCLAIMQDNSLKSKTSIEAFDFRQSEVDINERKRK